MVSLVVALALASGCSSRRVTTDAPDAGLLEFDAAMIVGPDAGAADAHTPSPDSGHDAGRPACTASMSADGVLTNHPEATFTNLGGPLVLRTAHVTVVDGSSTNALVVFGEIENTGTSIQCTPLPNLYVGDLHLDAVASGPAAIVAGTVSEACIPPGERGVVFGIVDDVSPSIVSPLTSVQYAMNGQGTYPPFDTSGVPVIESSELQSTSTGWVVAGTARVAVPIRNVRLEFYGRNECGLVYGNWTAFPGDSVTEAAGTFDFQTYPDEIDPMADAPHDWLAYASYIQD